MVIDTTILHIAVPSLALGASANEVLWIIDATNEKSTTVSPRRTHS